jgi:hypothetical protein
MRVLVRLIYITYQSLSNEKNKGLLCLKIMKILFSKKIHCQNNSQTSQSKGNPCFEVKIHNLFFLFASHKLLLIKTATTNATVPNTTLKINAQILNFGLFAARGKITATPNQPADRFIKSSETACSQVSIFQLYHNPTVTQAESLTYED